MSGFSFNFVQVLIGFGLAALIAAVSYRTHSLTVGGALCLIAIGTIVFGFGEIPFGAPIVFFFVSSSLLSRLKSSVKAKAMEAFDKIGARDYKQVLANGGVGAVSTILYILTAWPGWYLVYLAAIGEACADTWATEVGTMSRRQPRHIINFRKVEPGRSGGVTPLGTSAALAGSLFTVLIGYWALKIAPLMELSPWSVIACIAAGFLSSIADSVLGATCQAQYRNHLTGKVTEKPFSKGQKNTLIGGVEFINNDVVNFLGTFTSGIIMIIVIILFF